MNGMPGCCATHRNPKIYRVHTRRIFKECLHLYIVQNKHKAINIYQNDISRNVHVLKCT